MKEIFDDGLLTFYLEKHGIQRFFSMPNPPFRMFQYEPGEVLNVLHNPEEYLIFVVEGAYQGSMTLPIEHFPGTISYKDFGVIGDIHFATNCGNIFFYDAVSTVTTIELFLPPITEELKADVVFLRWIIHRLGGTIMAMTPHLLNFPLDKLLIYHLRYECADFRITDVQNTANRLGRSRSQLQRVLKKLTAEGIVLHEGKGVYTLAEHLRTSECLARKQYASKWN